MLQLLRVTLKNMKKASLILTFFLMFFLVCGALAAQNNTKNSANSNSNSVTNNSQGNKQHKGASPNEPSSQQKNTTKNIEPKNIHNSNNLTKTQEQNKTKSQGEKTQLRQTEQLEIRVKTANDLRQLLNKKQAELNSSLRSKNSKIKNIYQNQNKVKLAVQALLGMGGLMDKKFGPEVSEIAKQFNASVKSTIQAEEKIQNRNQFIRFFMGGDKNAAKEIKRQVQQNKKRIQELKKIYTECQDCDGQTKELLKEQIQNIEQEQIRLDKMAQKEEESRGLLGYLFGWLF